MFNVTKTQPAPPCLAIEKQKNNGNYNCGPVTELLEKDFHGKCYLCEEKATSTQTDHFIPHKNDVDLKFSWDNLVLSCNHCNNTKWKREGFLDCTYSAHDVESWISLSLSTALKEEVVVELRNVPKAYQTIANNTKELLQDIYQGTTQRKQLESAKMREKIREKLDVFKNRIIEYQTSLQKNLEASQKASALRDEIIMLMGAESEFSGFTRSYVEDRPKLKAALNL